MVTIEDNVVSGGFGAGVLEDLAGHGLAGKVRVLGVRDAFQPHGAADTILSRNGLDSESIAESVLGWLDRAD